MGEFEDSISFLLGHICRAHRQAAQNGLNELGLHAGQEMILNQLWEQDGLTQSQLADAACVEPPTITKMMSRMENAGVICRRTDPEDARVSRVYLTESSRALQTQVAGVFDRLEAQLVQGLTETERVLLRRLLLQLRENLSGESQP